MAYLYRPTVATRNALAAAHGARLDGGTRELRTGPPPTLSSDPDAGTLIATFAFGSPAFGSPSNGVVTANAIANVTAIAGGTIGHFRDKTSGGAAVVDGTVTNLAGDGAYKLDDPSPVLGATSDRRHDHAFAT